MLTPERIIELEQQSYVEYDRPVRTTDCWGDEKVTYEKSECFNKFVFAHAIEAEVRKQDTELIRQLLEALETYQGFIDDAHITEGQFHWLDDAKPAITAAKTRLEFSTVEEKAKNIAARLTTAMLSDEYLNSAKQADTGGSLIGKKLEPKENK